MTIDHKTLALAFEFSRELRSTCGPQTMAEIIARNAAEPCSAVCHSHDFTDANVIMATAWERVFGGEPPMICDGASYDEKEAATAIENAAWDYAKARGFSTGPETWQDVSHLFPDCVLALSNGRAVLFIGGPMGDAQSRFTVSATDADGLPDGDLYLGDDWQAACAAMEG